MNIKKSPLGEMSDEHNPPYTHMISVTHSPQQPRGQITSVIIEMEQNAKDS